jgi:DeoR/GlpR family transcriptional regulator of sugar metabolism
MIAEYLYRQRNWTMEQIAKALNTSRSTIQRDLGNLPIAGKLAHEQTESNPKGAGRKKGSKSKRQTTTQEEQKIATAVLDEGMMERTVFGQGK